MNPFRYGQVVTKDHYCRRPELEEKLRSRMLSGQYTYIEGPATISKALQRLADLKTLFTRSGEYRFVNPFFAQWLVHMNY